MKRQNKSYTLVDYYKYYIDDMEENNPYYIDLKLYREIVSEYLKFLSESVILKSKEIKLPSRLGSLFVFKKKPARYEYKFLRVDFRSSRDTGKQILHLNEHCDGYNYRFRWQKKDGYVKNQSMYEMVMSRANKRLLAKAIKEYRVDYIELK